MYLVPWSPALHWRWATATSPGPDAPADRKAEITPGIKKGAALIVGGPLSAIAETRNDYPCDASAEGRVGCRTRTMDSLDLALDPVASQSPEHLNLGPQFLAWDTAICTT